MLLLHKVTAIIFLIFFSLILCFVIVIFLSVAPLFFKGKEPSKVKIKYKDKFYNILKWEKEQKVRPIGEEKNPSHEIAVKVTAGWNATANIDSETVVIGWGPSKHLTVWGTLTLTIIISITLLWRHYLIKKRNYYKNALFKTKK